MSASPQPVSLTLGSTPFHPAPPVADAVTTCAQRALQDIQSSAWFLENFGLFIATKSTKEPFQIRLSTDKDKNIVVTVTLPRAADGSAPARPAPSLSCTLSPPAPSATPAAPPPPSSTWKRAVSAVTSWVRPRRDNPTPAAAEPPPPSLFETTRAFLDSLQRVATLPLPPPLKTASPAAPTSTAPKKTTIEPLGTLYTDDNINVLTQHFFQEACLADPSLANTTLLCHGISGDQTGGQALLETLYEARAKALLEQRPIQRILVPLHLHDHWTTLCIELDQPIGSDYDPKAQATHFFYFDPLGNDLSLPLKNLLLAQFRSTEKDWIYNQKPLQEDTFNCGPWIVEFIRHALNPTEEFTGRVASKKGTTPKGTPIEGINVFRAEHQHILEQKRGSPAS